MVGLHQNSSFIIWTIVKKLWSIVLTYDWQFIMMDSGLQYMQMAAYA